MFKDAYRTSINPFTCPFRWPSVALFTVPIGLKLKMNISLGAVASKWILMSNWFNWFCVKFPDASASYPTLGQRLLLYRHEPKDPNILQLVTSPKQICSGDVIEIVLSGEPLNAAGDYAWHLKLILTQYTALYNSRHRTKRGWWSYPSGSGMDLIQSDTPIRGWITKLAYLYFLVSWGFMTFLYILSISHQE